MRRDQSNAGGDYRREHNQSMGDRPGLMQIIWPFPMDRRNAEIARKAVEEQAIGD